ncbi:putative phosphotransferase system IIB component [Streptomyces sp. Tu6071]|nr:putative phosphotransferase system IIB component [Streptomyces sp. Tu6071]
MGARGLEGGLVDLGGVVDLGAQPGDAALDVADVVEAAESGDDLLRLAGHAPRSLCPVLRDGGFVTLTHRWPIFTGDGNRGAES